MLYPEAMVPCQEVLTCLKRSAHWCQNHMKKTEHESTKAGELAMEVAVGCKDSHRSGDSRKKQIITSNMHQLIGEKQVSTLFPRSIEGSNPT